MTPEVLAHERPYLVGLAYRMLGAVSEAEDVVQDALARASGIEDARSPRALLTTMVTRLCLDELKTARRRRESYVGPWLPEPVLTPEPVADARSPDDRVAAAESVSVALLLLLEALSPHERAVFVLREALDLDFADIAVAVDRSEAACRQLLHRARARVAERKPRLAAPAERRDLAARFAVALAVGDVEAVLAMLAPDAVSVADHGGKASAATRAVAGADRVARLLLGLTRKAVARSMPVTFGWVNGNPALLAWEEGLLSSVVGFEVHDGARGPEIARVWVTRNPDKLGRELPSLA